MVTYILRSRSPRFHGPVILPYILNTICWINVTPGILLPCDPMNDHLLYLGHCDLYFMVQQSSRKHRIRRIFTPIFAFVRVKFPSEDSHLRSIATGRPN